MRSSSSILMVCCGLDLGLGVDWGFADGGSSGTGFFRGLEGGFGGLVELDLKRRDLVELDFRVLMGLRGLVAFGLEMMVVLSRLGLELGGVGLDDRVLLSLDLMLAADRVLLNFDFAVRLEIVEEEDEVVELVFLGLRDLVVFLTSITMDSGFFFAVDLDFGIGESRSSWSLIETRLLLGN